jgi:uncharacterized membrane protein
LWEILLIADWRKCRHSKPLCAGFEFSGCAAKSLTNGAAQSKTVVGTICHDRINQGEAMKLPRIGMGTTLAVTAFIFAFVSVAQADLRLCNKTGSRVGVAIGYKSASAESTWMTEGWWNIESDACEILLAGTLSSRYYYVYAIDYDNNGEWGGRALMCTRDKEFTIKGVSDCLARGFQKTGFFEVDTGKQAGWTVQLTEPASRGVGGR